MESPALWLRNICLKNGLGLDDEQARLIGLYVSYLLDWNRKVNLISRQDEEQIWQNHILHSISLLFKVKLKMDSNIIDLGTGGGLPGIPLKILLPDADLLLVDATRKKVMAIQDILARLGLKGITAVWGRAEELSQDKNLRAHFDYIVVRAVAPLKNLIGWSVPFLRHQRISDITARKTSLVLPPALIALKGGEIADETAEAMLMKGVQSVETVNLVFPGSEEMSAGGKKVVIVRF